MRKSRPREAGQVVRSHILRQPQGPTGIPRISWAHVEASSVNAGWPNKKGNMLTFIQETFKSHVSEWICPLHMHASEECSPVFIMLPSELPCGILASLSTQFLRCEPVSSSSPSSADIKSYWFNFKHAPAPTSAYTVGFPSFQWVLQLLVFLLKVRVIFLLKNFLLHSRVNL